MKCSSSIHTNLSSFLLSFVTDITTTGATVFALRVLNVEVDYRLGFSFFVYYSSSLLLSHLSTSSIIFSYIFLSIFSTTAPLFFNYTLKSCYILLSRAFFWNYLHPHCAKWRGCRRMIDIVLCDWCLILLVPGKEWYSFLLNYPFFPGLSSKGLNFSGRPRMIQSSFYSFGCTHTKSARADALGLQCDRVTRLYRHSSVTWKVQALQLVSEWNACHGVSHAVAQYKQRGTQHAGC